MKDKAAPNNALKNFFISLYQYFVRKRKKRSAQILHR